MNRHSDRRLGIRFLARLAALAGTALAVSVCGEQGRFGGGGVVGPTGDTDPPLVQLVLPGGAADTVVDITDSLRFSAVATDNVRLKSLRVQVGGLGFVMDTIPTDTTFSTSSAATSCTKSYSIPLPANSAGQRIILSIVAVDGSDNVGLFSDTLRVNDGQPPVITMTSPTASVRVGAGEDLTVIARAVDPSGVRFLGARLFVRDSVLQRVTTLAVDSHAYAAAVTTKIDTFVVPVPAALRPGDYLIHVFGADSSPNMNATATVDFPIAVRDITPPTVTILGPAVDSGVSAGDSVLVQFRVEDNSGVSGVTVEGFAVRGDSSLGTATDVPHFAPKSISLSWATDTTLRRYLNATAETRAEPVLLRVTASDAAGNRISALRRIQIVTGASVRLVAPAVGTTHAVGNPLAVTVTGYDPDSVTVVGYASSGSIASRDSSLFVSPLGTSRTAALSLPVPGTTRLGQDADTITPFVIDRLGNRTVGVPLSVTFVDATLPTVNFVSPTADTGVVAGDGVGVRVRVRDNAPGTSVSVLGRAVSGATWFTPATIPGVSVVDDTVAVSLLASSQQDPAGGVVYLVATATDGVGNSSSDSIRIQVTSGPFVRITSPANGDSVLLGQSGARILPVVQAFNPDTILYLGFQATGRITVSDSVATTRPLTSTTLAQQLTLDVPDTTRLGAVILTPFVRTRSGNRLTGPSVTVALVDGSVPVVRILSPARAGTDRSPAGDSLFVRVAASDDRELASLDIEGFARRPDVWPDSLGQVDWVTRYTRKTVDLTGSVRDTLVRYLNAVLTDSTAEYAYIIATATDKAGNRGTDTVRVQVTGGSYVRLTAPAAGERPPIGNPLSVTVRGFDADSVKYLGYVGSGVVAVSDSVLVALDTGATRTLALLTTTTTPIGSETITPFLVDRLDNRIVGGAVTVTFSDTLKPTVSIDTPAVANLPLSVGDSVYVSVHLTDNRGVTQVVLTGTSQRGSAALGTDTTVTRFVSKTVNIAPDQDTVITRYLLPVPSDSTSELVTITATARDSSGNTAGATATVRIVGGPALTVVRPAAGAATSVGKSVIIEVRGVDQNGVRLIGWRATGVLSPAQQDSILLSPVMGDLADTATFLDTLVIPALTPLGTFSITPFGADSLGDVSGTVSGVTVTVQSSAGDVSPPAVQFSVGRRIETDDSVTVAATDAGGIRNLGFRVTLLDTTSLVRFDTLATGTLNGTLSDVSRRFSLALPDTLRFPSQVIVRGWARDSAGNPAWSTAADTLTVVAGKTYGLPAGSRVADAIYNQRRRELYLSNIARDRVEVFSLVSNTFVASIPVGSRPWGLALWPRATSTDPNDTLYADTLVVANSGGTNLSIVDLVSRREVRRHRLPNYLVQKIKIVDAGAGGQALQITDYDLSDRPQHVGTVCRAGAATACDSVIAVYSTTPTPSQTTPYPARGYVAWENISRTSGSPIGQGHFFWEQGALGATATPDTVQIIAVRDTIPGQAIRDTIVGGGAGIIVDFARMAFQDTTYVRNSGNFTRVVIGEGGGALDFARVMAYDGSGGMTTLSGRTRQVITGVQLDSTAHKDLGISEGIQVQDFIGNRASRVTSIATNFTGTTNLVRADSIYVFNYVLRQTGMLQVSGMAHGMDLAPLHAFNANLRGTNTIPGDGDADARIVFAARPDSSIDVFDTYFFGQVTDTSVAGVPIPIRNALVGAVRVTPDSGGTVLTGITNQGLVVVRLPTLTNPFPAPVMRPAALPAALPQGDVRRGRGTSPPSD